MEKPSWHDELQHEQNIEMKIKSQALSPRPTEAGLKTGTPRTKMFKNVSDKTVQLMTA